MSEDKIILCSSEKTRQILHKARNNNIVKLRQGSGKDRQGMALKSGVGCDVSIDYVCFDMDRIMNLIY